LREPGKAGRNESASFPRQQGFQTARLVIHLDLAGLINVNGFPRSRE
jgi:hypothetical protein